MEVFISYSSKNQRHADRVVEHLEKHGIKCWIANRDIASGADYSTSIVQAIENTKVFLLLLSNDSMNSKHVKSELELAFGRQKAITPFKLDDASPINGFEYFLNLKQFINANPSPNVNEDLNKAVDCIRGILTDWSSNAQKNTNAPNKSQPLYKKKLTGTRCKPAFIMGLVCSIILIVICITFLAIYAFVAFYGFAFGIGETEMQIIGDRLISLAIVLLIVTAIITLCSIITIVGAANSRTRALAGGIVSFIASLIMLGCIWYLFREYNNFYAWSVETNLLEITIMARVLLMVGIWVKAIPIALIVLGSIISIGYGAAGIVKQRKNSL